MSALIFFSLTLLHVAGQFFAGTFFFDNELEGNKPCSIFWSEHAVKVFS
jgi:hypothetical protein